MTLDAEPPVKSSFWETLLFHNDVFDFDSSAPLGILGTDPDFKTMVELWAGDYAIVDCNQQFEIDLYFLSLAMKNAGEHLNALLLSSPGNPSEKVISVNTLVGIAGGFSSGGRGGGVGVKTWLAYCSHCGSPQA